MPASDPVAKLEELLLARGMSRQDLPDFIGRYAKRPVLDAAMELQQRGIRYQIAYDAIAKLQEPTNARESSLDSPFKLSATGWVSLSLVFVGAGLWQLKTGLFAGKFGPWLAVGFCVLGASFALGAISKWLG